MSYQSYLPDSGRLGGPGDVGVLDARAAGPTIPGGTSHVHSLVREAYQVRLAPA